MSKTGEHVGLLNKTLHGSRDAPAVWQIELEQTLCRMGFQACVTTPCVYLNKISGVWLAAHVDDLLAEGSWRNLEDFAQELAGRYDIKSYIIGPDKDELCEGTFLGRRIQWTNEGLTWTGDDKLVRDLLKEWNMETAKASYTPGVTEADRMEIDQVNEVPMEAALAKAYRSAAAKLNYLSLDNFRVVFASKEI